MNENTEQILQKLKGKRVGVFVDDSNFYHAYQKYSWRIDFGEFRKLISQYCDLLELKNYVVQDKKKTLLFMGYKENMAWELRLCWHLYINKIRDEIGLK